ncbi:hypothetical protein JW960_20095 [candidate division KSB1 bacterium]|nr:hypothetical protein [candidate division KSB1 bacterium]
MIFISLGKEQLNNNLQSLLFRSMLYLVLFTTIQNLTYACTVFYATDGHIILGGNNEDWSDPNTLIIFHPAENGKNGWIQFGFNAGWPQGGMNEHGLFWDATACTYLEMPKSEATKTRYDGSLMRKVMDECVSVTDALAVFKNYYCDDLYNSQYLIGDSIGASMIVDGDNYILNNTNYQVMTNFYQSHPELGGYPCWRYDKATAMLDSAMTITPRLFGSILAATHQEGRYPTQYSNIYDLKNCFVYLFYLYNFEEYIAIDLNEQLANGQATYSLPALFSQMKITSPLQGAEVSQSSVTFRWQGKPVSNYQLYYSTHPDFAGCISIPVTAKHLCSEGIYNGTVIFIIGMFFFVPRVKRRQVFFMLSGVLLYMSTTISGCQKDATAPEQTGTELREFEITIDNLEPDAKYYWKVEARPNGTECFISTSLIHHFYTLKYQ